MSETHVINDVNGSISLDSSGQFDLLTIPYIRNGTLETPYRVDTRRVSFYIIVYCPHRRLMGIGELIVFICLLHLSVQAGEGGLVLDKQRLVGLITGLEICLVGFSPPRC